MAAVIVLGQAKPKSNLQSSKALYTKQVLISSTNLSHKLFL